jgi:hypothetical protein
VHRLARRASVHPAGVVFRRRRCKAADRSRSCYQYLGARVLAPIGWFAGRHLSFAPVALHASRTIDYKGGNNSSRRAVIGGGNT